MFMWENKPKKLKTNFRGKTAIKESTTKLPPATNV